jgi:hypothetical protein
MAWSQQFGGEISDDKCLSTHFGRQSNGYTVHNGYIASPWQSAM